jgi:hypothetical protein
VGLSKVAWSQVYRELRLEIGLAKVNRGRHVKLRQGKVSLLNEIKRGYHPRGRSWRACKDISVETS